MMIILEKTFLILTLTMFFSIIFSSQFYQLMEYKVPRYWLALLIPMLCGLGMISIIIVEKYLL